jgi:hypothetical protein
MQGVGWVRGKEGKNITKNRRGKKKNGGRRCGGKVEKQKSEKKFLKS